MISQTQTVKKLFTMTKEEIEWLRNYQHENKLSSENAAIKSLIHDKMEQTKSAINNFFYNDKMKKILTKLADK